MNGTARTITDRRSIRAFENRPVPRAQVEELLRLARCAPSGANLQPGRFHALSGDALADLSDALIDGIHKNRPQVSEYSYFPKPMPADLKMRQRAAGYALYNALGIEKRDVEGRRSQFEKNYRFFDAPVAIVVTIDRNLGNGSWMDMGMSIQTLLLAIHAAGLGACGVGALANYGDLVHDHLNLPEDELVVAGIALGYPAKHPVNDFRTEREPLDVFATFAGFKD